MQATGDFSGKGFVDTWTWSFSASQCAPLGEFDVGLGEWGYE